MKFTLNHKRAPMGNDLSVTITAEGAEKIKAVKIVLDGKTQANDTLRPMESAYNREVYGVGLAGPARGHTLVVTATDNNGTNRSASHRWTDKS